MKKNENKNKNKAMEGTLLVYNRSSPPISDFFFNYISLKKEPNYVYHGPH